MSQVPMYTILWTWRGQIGLSPTILSSSDNTATLNHLGYLLAWLRIDHYVSGLIIFTISHTRRYELVVFARVIHLANSINSLTHYIKSTLSLFLNEQWRLRIYIICGSKGLPLGVRHTDTHINTRRESYGADHSTVPINTTSDLGSRTFTCHFLLRTIIAHCPLIHIYKDR
jgi:hypothetical protein